jgi:nucleoside-diphosphate-sugar epimerase
MAAQSETLLITGSSGFIGKNMVEYFREDYHVLAPTHQELDLLSQEDVDNYFRDNQIDYVIHGANVGGNRTADDGPDVVEINLRMFFNICENSERFKKMIHFGSGAEYSKENMPPKVRESEFGKFIPKDHYGFSKYLISKYIEKADNIYCLRLFGVFGPGEDYRYKFISNSIVKNLLEMPIVIMQNVFFDWMYIEDLLRITDYFLKNEPSPNTYNVTSGKTTDLLSIARKINELSDFESDITVVNPGLNREYSGENTALLDEIGDFQFLKMEDSLRKLMDYYKSIYHTLDLETVQKDPYASRCKINK